MKFSVIRNTDIEKRVILGISSNFLGKVGGILSNLGLSDWLLVRSRSFRLWFGDWVDITTNDLIKNGGLLDKNGEPLIVSYDGGGLGYKFSHSLYGKNSYFLKLVDSCSIKWFGDDYFSLYSQLVIRSYGLMVHDILNLLELSDRYDRVMVKKFINYLYGGGEIVSGEELSRLLKLEIVNKRVINKDIRKFYKEFYILLNDGIYVFDSLYNDFRDLLKIGGLVVKNDLTGVTSYILFDSDDIRLNGLPNKYIKGFAEFR